MCLGLLPAPLPAGLGSTGLPRGSLCVTEVTPACVVGKLGRSRLLLPHRSRGESPLSQTRRHPSGCSSAPAATCHARRQLWGVPGAPPGIHKPLMAPPHPQGWVSPSAHGAPRSHVGVTPVRPWPHEPLPLCLEGSAPSRKGSIEQHIHPQPGDVSCPVQWLWAGVSRKLTGFVHVWSCPPCPAA